MAVQVLVADDGGAMSLALRHLMMIRGCAVRVAHDADDVLCATAEQRPDLVVLDAAIGGGGGFELCRTLRADPSLAGVRIVMLSARCDAIDAEKARALGADALVAKPVSCRALAERLGAFMSQVEANGAQLSGANV